MVSTHPRRTREVTGPTPHSVAIFARPTNKRPPEQLILDRRHQEEMRQKAEELTKYNKFCDLKNDWERGTDKKIQLNTVHRRVKGLLQAHQCGIEDRRERLRDLLVEEEQEYLAEMSDKEETVLERQAKMRTRAKVLKEKREHERLQVVQEKLEQQWREQCEELRSTMSKRHQDQVAAERLEQLKIKDSMESAQKEEDKLWSDLWYADMMAKASKEEQQTQRQMSANRDMLDVLNKQVAAMAAQKQEEESLKEEEALLLREQSELRKLEELHAAEEKRRRQEETKQNYDRSLQMKSRKAAREMQEQLAFDLKILEQLLEDSRNEAMEDAKRKRELREEGQRYRNYLRQMKEDEDAYANQLERLVDGEVEKAWQKKLAQWRLEKEARRKLLHDVLEGRKQQVHDKLLRNNQLLEEISKEREDLAGRIEQNRQLEAERAEVLSLNHQQHQADLLSQMGYNRRQRQDEFEEEERIWTSQREAEIEYQNKLEDALATDHVPKLHPIRRAVSGRRSGGIAGADLQISGTGVLRSGGAMNT